MAFLQAWEHILTMFGLQRPHFLMCRVFIYFYSLLTMSYYFVLAMEICNLDFGNDTHINNQIETMEGDSLHLLRC